MTRPDLIGERCNGNGQSGTLVRWLDCEDATYGMMLLADGSLWFVPAKDMYFPPKAEQPDELREAAGSVVLGIETEYEKWHEAIPEPLKSMLDNLRKALQ